MEISAANQDWRPLQAAMIERLKTAGSLRDSRVEEALRAVPRHEFVVDEVDPEEAYTGELFRVLASADGGTISTISNVRSVIGLLQTLQLQPGENALEIGLGTGFNAALMAYLASPGSVTSIDFAEVLVLNAEATLRRLGVTNVRPIARDGWLGDETSAPYDANLATVGVSDISPHWMAQLREGGRLVVPLWISAAFCPAVIFEKQGDSLNGRALGTQRYVMLRGRGQDELGDWVLIDGDYWMLRSAAGEAWTVLKELLAQDPAVDEKLPVEDDAWPWLPSWLGLEDPDVFVSGAGLVGLFDQHARGLAVVDPRSRIIRSYGERQTYERLVDLVVRRRPGSPKSLAGRTMSQLLVDAVPAGTGKEPKNGWLFSRDEFDLVVRLPENT